MTIRDGVGLVLLFTPVAFLATMAAIVIFGPAWGERDTTVSVSFFLAGIATAPLTTFLDRRTG